MDIGNIIIITILILILLWIISYFFFSTNIIFDQILKANENTSNEPSNSNYIKNEDFEENNTANFMISVWFYIDNWGNSLNSEKNVLFLGRNNQVKTNDQLKSQSVGISKKECNISDAELRDTKNFSVSLDDYQNILNIDIETLPKKSGDMSGCLTRYAIKNIPIQKWNCLIVSVDTKTMDVYLDGKLRNSFILHGPYRSELENGSKKNIYLGEQGDNNMGFEGYITRVRYEANSINPKEAYNIYKEGINASLAKSMFNKYSLKISFLEYNKERGSFTV